MAFGVANFPCFLRSFLLILVGPLIAGNILIQLMLFFFLSQLSKDLSKEKVLDEATQLELEAMKQSTMFRRLVHRGRQTRISLQALLCPMSSRTKLRRAQLIDALSFTASARGTFFIYGVLMLPFVVMAVSIAIVDPAYRAGCNGCYLKLSEILIVIILGILFVIFIVVVALKVRQYPDPWRLRRECFLETVSCAIMILGFGLGTFAESGKDVWYDHQLIMCFGMMCFIYVQTLHQISIEMRKRGVTATVGYVGKVRNDTASRSGSIVFNEPEKLLLSDVFDHPELAKLFDQFVANELGMESLLFLRDTEQWIQCYYDVAMSTRVIRARRIYRIYIAEDGQFTVNIPSRMVGSIRSQISSLDVEECSRELFDESRQEIVQLLTIGSLSRFKQSRQFEEFVCFQQSLSSKHQVLSARASGTSSPSQHVPAEIFEAYQQTSKGA